MTILAAVTACDQPSEPDAQTGSLALAVNGLPDTIPADITVTGPGGFSARVTRGQTFTTLTPGSYTVSATQVRTSLSTFAPAFSPLFVEVGPNAVSQASVIYSLTTGSLAVSVTGVPPDVPWKVLVTGPAGYRDSVSANATLGNLAPGPYAVSAGELQKGVNVYAPKPAQAIVTVAAVPAPAPAAIAYLLVTGALAIHVNGLPSGTTGNVSVTGPGGYQASATSSITLEGLLHGRYDISAAPANGSSGQYAPSPATQSVAVVPGAVGLVNVNYLRGTTPPGLNLAIEAVQLQQVVQTYGGGVPLIAGRDALLRVFVRASQPNVESPTVRARLYDGQQQVASLTIPAQAAGVPTATNEGDLATSWNIPVPGTTLRPGLRILVDIDPTNEVAESVEDDNTWPSSGAPLTLDVRDVTPLAVRLVPIAQTSTGLTGNVTESNSVQYYEAARRLLPVNQLAVDVRQPYTTSLPPLQAGDGNGSWINLLSELNALRAAEGSSAHYYGVAKVPYESGIIGISYLPSVVAAGWDVLPNAAATMTHELGHNFGRLHSGSCGSGGADGGYPHAGGNIGVYGYDPSTASLRPPFLPDIMGYCSDRWISDYTYTGILGFRATSTLSQVLAATGPRPGLLVWGRIGPGGVVMEPAFEVTAPPRLPSANGPHRLEALDESGNILASFQFRGEIVVDSPRADEEHFAFVVPMSAFGGSSPARLRLTASGRRVELASASRAAGARLAADPAPIVQRVSPSRVRVSWREAPGRGVMVRDSRTGSILALARGGSVTVSTNEGRVDLILSDGVRSARRSVLVR